MLEKKTLGGASRKVPAKITWQEVLLLQHSIRKLLLQPMVQSLLCRQWSLPSSCFSVPTELQTKPWDLSANASTMGLASRNCRGITSVSPACAKSHQHAALGWEPGLENYTGIHYSRAEIYKSLRNIVFSTIFGLYYTVSYATRGWNASERDNC